jgi:VanZ family protein
MNAQRRSGADPADAAPRRRSPLARRAALAWIGMVIYASLTPWSDWQDRGVSPFAYLAAPWPRHVTTFDVVVNVLGYLPLGITLVLALYPRVRGRYAVVAATMLAALLSGTMEALQTYLPSRVSSNVDLIANAVGAFAGAVAGSRIAPAVIDDGRIAQWRRRWLRHDDPIGLLLIGLWPLTQAHPTATLFGGGRLAQFGDALGEGLAGIGFDPASWWPTLTEPSDFVLLEAATTTAAILAIGLGASAAMQRHAPRLRLLLLMFCAGLGVKALAYGIAFGPDQALAWNTRGAVGGLLLGGFTLVAASHAPARVLPRLAAIGTLALLLFVNLGPQNPYHEAWLAQWQPGQLRNLSAAAGWFALCWPFGFFAWAVRRWLAT